MKNTQISTRKGVMCLAFLIITSGIYFFLCNSGSILQSCCRSDLSKSPKPEHSKLDAYAMSKQFVREKLVSPGSAKWPWEDYNLATTDLGGGRYSVSSYVDSQNVFGALLRTKFVCVIKYAGNENWVLESLIWME